MDDMETGNISAPSPYLPGKGDSRKREEIYPIPKGCAKPRPKDTGSAACEAIALSQKNADKLTPHLSDPEFLVSLRLLCHRLIMIWN